jgi:hypothetical protein
VNCEAGRVQTIVQRSAALGKPAGQTNLNCCVAIDSDEGIYASWFQARRWSWRGGGKTVWTFTGPGTTPCRQQKAVPLGLRPSSYSYH